MAVRTFESTLIKDDKTNGASIKIPFDVQEAFEKKGRVPVKCTIDGYPYQGSIVPCGGTYYMGVVKKIRDAIAKTYGNTVHIAMELDDGPRAVKVPEDFKRALAMTEAAKKAFDKMSYSHKREYVEWIESAKKVETRQRRITKAVEKLTGN